MSAISAAWVSLFICTCAKKCKSKRINTECYDRHINSTRHPIPDVPVLYLIEPTSDNLQRITADLSKGLYSPAHINFLSSIPRPLLEDFGAQTASANTSEHIAQVFDQYLNFVVAEPDLFSLSLKRCYETLNSSRTSDEELDTIVDRIVSGLFSVIVTMGMSSPDCLFHLTDLSRCNSHHTMSKRARSGNGRGETRSQAS